MNKKIISLSFALMLCSTSAMAGGSHYNNDTSTGAAYPDNANNYSNNMTMMGYNIYPYVGAEVGWMNANYSNAGGVNYDAVFQDTLWSIAPYVGLRAGKYFGLEAAYTWSNDEDEANAGLNSNSDTSIRGYSLDAMGYLPVTDDQKLELVGLVGVGRYSFDASGSIGGSPFAAGVDDDDTALRYGGGLQYEINPNWSTRMLYRRIEAETVALDSVDTVTLGLTYNFN